MFIQDNLEMVKEKLKVPYRKPYLRNDKRPKNAEELLKKV